ncbi:SWIM zinc finger family protein [Paenibacillus sp. LHD-117]|uniref:SWIM zinc finger family protein n=1 Tax=Paenibacillus sp. LHD-117 TaxID=3071412 RepID=UPI0027DF81A0|nr:SWIM zinc finger family protein [Paenibacillus sp. LHD-117]MDQ6418353.1 SWIM zinc finger family protein [Paenibacillus sp. LHD-117]
MRLFDDKIQTALEGQLSANMASTMIKRGWSYYKDGHVQNVKETTRDILTGIVRGSELYAVVIDADQFRYSTCTCPYVGFCKHMAAVYFYLCAELEGDEAAERSYFKLLGLAPASTLVKDEQRREQPRDAFQGDPGPEGTAAQWFDWMETEYGETFRKCRHSLHALQPVLSSLKGLSKDWEKPLQRLHWLTSILFALEQAERAILTVDSFSRYYHEMSFIRMAEPWLEHGYALLAELEPEAMSEGEWATADALAGRVKRRATLAERQLFDWPFLYLAFCEVLTVRREWFELELSKLLEAAERKEADQDESFLHAAAGMFYFIDGDDAASISHFAKSAFERTQRLVYPCVAQRMEAGKWESAEQWMAYLFERVHAARNARNIGPFMTLCRRADEDRPEQPIWTTYMTELLPYSYTELSEHWLNVKRYEDWADLQMLVGAKLEEIDAAGLREVVKISPESLLPLYHQSIEANIATRNRQGYRFAVKQLKKLERLYKGMKESERWESYLAGLTSKYQRLRALQEELWKGKIGT